jgi:anti-sigma B factor antagonist
LSRKNFQTQTLEIDVDRAEGAVVVRPRGELDLASTPDLRAILQEQYNRKASVLLDLSELTFLDSSGLRLIWETAAAAKQQGLELALTSGPPEVMRVFELTGLKKRLNFTDAS